MNFNAYILYSYIALIILIFIIFLIHSYYLKFIVTSFKKDPEYKDDSIKSKFIVLIPARNESKVIANLLNSLHAQTYDKDKFDVYIITESEDDPSNKIALDKGYKYIVRKDIEGKRTKGFALQEALIYIKENAINYDSLIILDADNIVDRNFILELNRLKNGGYQIGVCLRKSTNANKNVISSTSAILFTYQSVFVNKIRALLYKKIAISGTGYFVDRELIDKNGGWIWTGITEDVELTRYAYNHGVKMGYNPKAIIYDEQPTDIKTMHNQHLRWVWGYYGKTNFKKYEKPTPTFGPINKFAIFEHNNSMNLFIQSEVMITIHIAFLLVMIGFAAYYNPIYTLYFILLIVLDLILILFVCDVVLLIEVIFLINI